MDKEDGGREEDQRQREQPAALDEMERPEAAGWLVGEPLEMVVRGQELLQRAGADGPLAAVAELGEDAARASRPRLPVPPGTSRRRPGPVRDHEGSAAYER